MQIWIVTRDGPEWSDIVGAYQSPESANDLRDKLTRDARGSASEFEKLSTYHVREVSLEE